MILDIFVISLFLSLIFKKRVYHLHETNIRLVYLLPLPFIVQFLPMENRLLAMMVSYTILFFLLTINWRVKGFKFIFFGSVLNFVAIVLNNGKMPVYGPLAVAMNLTPSIKHVLIEKFSPILSIGDIIPAYTPWGRKFLISVGDVFVYIGLVAFMLTKPERSSFKRAF